jgi:hypothetical protein
MKTEILKAIAHHLHHHGIKATTSINPTQYDPLLCIWYNKNKPDHYFCIDIDNNKGTAIIWLPCTSELGHNESTNSLNYDLADPKLLEKITQGIQNIIKETQQLK